MFLAGGFSRLGTDTGNRQYGNAAVAMVYLFTAVFGATWLTVPWLLPAEYFPLQVRAKGNAWGVIGWSIGNGWLTLLCPVMFDHIGEKTLYIFGACNILSIRKPSDRARFPLLTWPYSDGVGTVSRNESKIPRGDRPPILYRQSMGLEGGGELQVPERAES